MGKSVTIITRQRIIAELVAGYRSIYIVPHGDQLTTYQRKFQSMERLFRVPVNGNKYKQNMGFKEYPNGAEIDMLRINTSSASARGKSCDELIFDEVQGMDGNLETDVLQVLADSDIRTKLYTGTSTTLDTLLEARYQEGSQGTWHIFRDNLKSRSTIDCGDPDQIIPCIKREGLIDPKTGDRLNPLRGRYVHSNPEGLVKRMFSVHVPQIINPDIVRNQMKWEELHTTLMRDRTAFIKECLGIPVAEADREISEIDLRRMCVVEGGPDERKKRCRTRKYRFIMSGMDWGGSDYNTDLKTKKSRTAHAIIGVTPDDRVHILHLRTHAGMDYPTICNLIMKDHAAYGAGAMASDFGGGQVYLQMFRQHPLFDARRHVIFDYSGVINVACKPMADTTLQNAFVLNRTESISGLILAIISGQLLCFDWQECKEELREFLNCFRILTEKSTGENRFRYIKHGAKADDCMHAVNFVYMLLRLVTNQELIQDPGAALNIRNAVYGGSNATHGASASPMVAALRGYADS